MEGREMELLAFIASLEGNKKMRNPLVDEVIREEVAGGEKAMKTAFKIFS